MLTWRDIVIHGLGKKYPPEVVFVIFHFLKREHIIHLCEESRNYHVCRMPRVVRKPRIMGFPKKGFYLDTQCGDGCGWNVYIYGEILDEFTDKWYTINPKSKEYTYMDCWKWDRFNYPYMNFISSFNRGRIFLRFRKGYEWYDMNSEDNIVDKLTDYKEIS